ncbi:hypothetical protein ACP3WL_25370, partial [Salmonella enterica]
NAVTLKDSKRGGSNAVTATLREIGRRARSASRAVARATTGEKNAALFALARISEDEAAEILEANAADLRAARDANLE